MRKTLKIVDHYNKMVNSKNYINIDNIYDGYNHLNETSYNFGDECIDDMILNENIKKLEILYITNNIKFDEEEEKMDIELFDEEIDEKNVYENINEMNDNLSQKQLLFNIENKEYHELLNNAEGETKAKILSLRSNKCNQWLHRQIGVNIKGKYTMNNEIFSKISRMHFGVNIVPNISDEEILKCSKCGYKMDIYGKHAMNCKLGKGPTWRHDKINEFIGKLIGEITTNYYVEPTSLDRDSQQRPDIIIHDEIEYDKNKHAPCYIDTMITDIYKQKNMDQINVNNFSIFNAGKLAEKDKRDLYIDRFHDLKEKGYIFIPFIMESTGGIGSDMRKVINYYLKKKANIKNRDFSVIVHNYYIQFSIYYQKLRYETLWNHYRLL